MMRAAVVAACVIASTAHAGICLGPEEADADMALVEAAAKDAANLGAVDREYGWLCTSLDAKRLARRIERACKLILDRDGNASRCVEVAAAAGFTTLGGHDIFALVTADHRLDEDPIDSPGGIGLGRLELFVRMGDPRGAALIVADWNAAIPRADKREKRHGEMASWNGWRQRAANALGVIGGAADAAFLTEQASATVDPHVAQACRDGAAAIAKRITP